MTKKYWYYKVLLLFIGICNKYLELYYNEKYNKLIALETRNLMYSYNRNLIGKMNCWNMSKKINYVSYGALSKFQAFIMLNDCWHPIIIDMMEINLKKLQFENPWLVWWAANLLLIEFSYERVGQQLQSLKRKSI